MPLNYLSSKQIIPLIQEELGWSPNTNSLRELALIGEVRCLFRGIKIFFAIEEIVPDLLEWKENKRKRLAENHQKKQQAQISSPIPSVPATWAERAEAWAIISRRKKLENNNEKAKSPKPSYRERFPKKK